VALTLRQAITRNNNTTVIPRESGVSSTPQLLHSITTSSGILDHPLSRMMTSEKADLLAAARRQ
jgi:hypothetical protein